MDSTLLSTRAAFIIFLMTLSGCAVKLTNLTPASGPHNGIVNRHEFSADVVPPRNHEIRTVSLDRRGRIDAMRNSTGTIWNRSVSIEACDEIVPYRFVVEYDESSDTRPPHSRTLFPKTGSYLKTITNLPSDCRGEDFGARAFDVNTFNDTVDATPDDLECLDAEAECSLRAAIMQANATPGINLIRLPTGIYRLTRMGSDNPATPEAAIGDLDITDSLVIQTEGNCDYELDNLFILPTPQMFPIPDNAYEARDDSLITSVVATIDANGIDRVLDIYESTSPQQQVEVYLNCLQIRGGYLLGPEFNGPPPAMGAGIYNRATLLVNQSVIASNNIEEKGNGAGIFNDGELLLRNSAIYNNRDDESDRRGEGFGGVSGGGLYNNINAVATLEQSLVARNASARAGAIWNHGPTSVDEQGRPNVPGAGELTLVNSTVADNETPRGSVAEKVSIANYGSASIYWSTVAETLKSLHTGIGQTQIGNSIIFSELGTTCSAGSGASPLPGATRILSLGGNFFSGDDCHNPRNTLDTPNAYTVLSEGLVNMGGFTPVLRLSAPVADLASAVDAVLGGGLPSCPDTDQRGFTRPQNGDDDPPAVCDSGAFERQPSDF